jgi:Putative DNA-binding domain
MRSLAEIQDAVQRSILNTSADILPEVAKPPYRSKMQAFGVYQSAYTMRLTEFLANDYEKLRSYIGEVRFNAMSLAFAGAHPSRHANARWFGQGLPGWLNWNWPLPRHLTHLIYRSSASTPWPHCHLIKLPVRPFHFTHACRRCTSSRTL